MKSFSNAENGDMITIINGFNHPLTGNFHPTGREVGEITRRYKFKIYVKVGRRKPVVLNKSAYEENYKRVMTI
jgi:hypothetical protein